MTRAARKVSQVGGSLRDVQELAGHTSLAMTQRDIDGDTEAKRKLVALLGDRALQGYITAVTLHPLRTGWKERNNLFRGDMVRKETPRTEAISRSERGTAGVDASHKDSQQGWHHVLRVTP
jgi:hypothetical protein